MDDYVKSVAKIAEINTPVTIHSEVPPAGPQAVYIPVGAVLNLHRKCGANPIWPGPTLAGCLHRNRSQPGAVLGILTAVHVEPIFVVRRGVGSIQDEKRIARLELTDRLIERAPGGLRRAPVAPVGSVRTDIVGLGLDRSGGEIGSQSQREGGALLC